MTPVEWFFSTLFLIAALILSVHYYTKKHNELLETYTSKRKISKIWMIIPIYLYVFIIALIVATDSFKDLFALVILIIMVLSILFALTKAVIDVQQAKKLHTKKNE